MAAHFGMVGLGTMGRNLVLNMADHEYEICGYDKDPAQRAILLKEASGKPVSTATSIGNMANALSTPRVIMFLVPAGEIVDIVINEISPFLEKGDVLIDGGNSYFMDTARRYQALQGNGIHYIGMGVSGGEEGARFGPSLMPGGNKESYDIVAKILEATAAKSDEGPCVTYIGETASGHYTKMVHNGIEYALMQLISEIYWILKNAGGFSNSELHNVFNEWNKKELQSFLLEISADIFLKKDDETGSDLVDVILDKARQKGTGMWTSQSAMELNVPTPVIDAAVTMRYISSMKEERVTASEKINTKEDNESVVDKNELTALCRDALFFAQALSYGQGIHLLSVASATYDYKINIAEVIRIWKGGCIIRSAMLNDLRKAYIQDPALPNIIQSPLFSKSLLENRNAIAKLVHIASNNYIPVACLSAALNYFDAYCSKHLPANLIQAQRDYFGAHTYERIDKAGRFHTDWN